MGRCDGGTAVVITSSRGCPERGIIDPDAPPGFQDGTDGRLIVSLRIARPMATYRRQFDGRVRKLDEDPANFGITLETLAVKAFGDIGQTARLRLIRDRFIAGHESCELRRHLDCLPPDTPLRDIVDRCRVWGKSFGLVGTECKSTKDYVPGLRGQAGR